MQTSQTPDLDTLITRLEKNAAFKTTTDTLEHIETHISHLVLSRDYVWKFKKAVNFGFLDFSSLAKRRLLCLEELRLNQRLAPEIYLDVVAVTRSGETFEFDGKGETIEFAVLMRRFDYNRQLDKLLQQQQLPQRAIENLGDVIFDFHAQADNQVPQDVDVGPSVISYWFFENFDHILPQVQHHPDSLEQVMQLKHWGEKTFARLQEKFEQRQRCGFVRECHGDLHLGNIAIIEGRVTPFDCIEFNPQLRWIDTLSDIAFVLMDLAYRGQKPLAYRFLNRYLAGSGDYDGLAVLAFYQVYRALVRAKVALLSSPDDADIPEDYKRYIDLASAFASPKTTSLLLTHGVSGSGKSVYAAALANHYGLIHLRSDVERKRMAGLAALDNSASEPNRGIYTQAYNRKTYNKLYSLAGKLLQSGFSVVIDATYSDAKQRKRMQQLASEHSSHFHILSLFADRETLEKRILDRASRGQDASEANLQVLQTQLDSDGQLNSNELGHASLINSAVLSPQDTDFLQQFEWLKQP